MNQCEHVDAARIPLYVDGRPVYQCHNCGVRFVYDDDDPSYKALAPIRDLPNMADPE